MRIHSRHAFHVDPAGQSIPGTDATRPNMLGYSTAEEESIHGQIQRLLTSHGVAPAYGDRHAAPCSIWRSERIQLSTASREDRVSPTAKVGYPPRFANRVHLFEESPEAKDKGIGPYLGFVSLRPRVSPSSCEAKHYPNIVIANLTVPTHMLAPRYHVITCTGGFAENVIPFRCVPFCVPNPDFRYRVTCLHVALHEALLLKAASYGAKPISSQDMISLLWRLGHEQPQRGSRHQEYTLSHLTKRGASLSQALQVLQHESVSAGGIIERFEFSDPGGDNPASQRVLADVLRTLTDYIANGLPVIAYSPVPGARAADGQSPVYHAMLVFGMRMVDDLPEASASTGPLGEEPAVERAGLPDRFIANDFSSVPFREFGTDELLQLIRWRTQDKEDGTERGGITFLAVAPAKTRLGVRPVRQTARMAVAAVDPQALHAYCRYVGSDARVPSQAAEPCDLLRLHPRFLTRARAVQLYSGICDRSALRTATRGEDFVWAVEVTPRALPATSPDSPLRTAPFQLYVWGASQPGEDAASALFCVSYGTDGKWSMVG
jgi:hypothetical protein